MDNKTLLRDGTQHCRIILGGWQLSEGHSTSQDDSTIESYINHGIDAIDCADIYTGVEDAVGKTLAKNGSYNVRVHTKHVPDIIDVREGKISEESTRALIHRSINRIGSPYIDLVQFHQWDYNIDSYKISIQALKEMQREGIIRGVGVTNSSVVFLKKLEIECDFTPLTTQNQYNILDRRPEKFLLPYCNAYKIAFYAYGSLMGGLLSEKYLNQPKPIEPLENRSLRKYIQIIDDWADWEMFQELLNTLVEIGQRYQATISEVAMNWVLSRSGVNAIIVGARHPKHANTIHNIFHFELDEEDIEKIDSIYFLGKELTGDVFDLERYEPRHRDIMKMNLNKD